MQYLAYSIAVWSVLALSGLPLALILLPHELRQRALPAAPLFGYAYIVFVAYYIYRANIGGTNLYAPYLLVPPIAALAVLLWRRRLPLAILFDRDTAAMLGLATLSFLAVSLLYLYAHGRAVALVLTNLDIAEYASDARYMQEFARDTKIGFMGQSDWLMFEGDGYWFGPAMIAAVMSSLTHSEPFRLQSLVLSVIACQGAAFVYAIARDSLTLDRTTALALGLLYAINPVVAYAVWQGYGAQTISMALMLVVVYLVTRAQIAPAEPRVQARYLPAIVLLFSGMFVTYHFMVGIVGALLGCYFFVFALAERSPKRLVTGAALLATALALTVVLNPLWLLATLDAVAAVKGAEAGWFIPWLSPDVQLGFAAALKLVGNGFAIDEGWGVALAILLTLAMTAHLVGRRSRPAHLALALGLALPTFLLGLFYAVPETQGGVLGGYRSFKVTSTFLAFTLIAYGLCFGVERVRWRRSVTAAGGVMVAALAVLAAVDLRDTVRHSEHFVPPEELTGIRKVETMDFVSGINVMKDTPFNLFWTHYFTLGKPQIYQTFPYGGRVVGALTEPYRLTPDPNAPGPASAGDIFAVESVGCDELYRLTSRLWLCRPKANADVTATPGAGWWGPEEGFRWSGRTGRTVEVLLESRLTGSWARLKVFYEALRSGDAVSLKVNGEPVPVEETGTELVSAPFILKSGRNLARFTEALDPAAAPPPDPRTLGVRYRQVLIEFPKPPAEPLVQER